MGKGTPFGCGQCLPCRINRSRQWARRQLLESLCHDDNTFATLTYDDEHLPAGGELVPRDLQLWLKRFRKGHGGKLRFYGVGEYGEKTGRPHYHLSLFGVHWSSVVPRPSLSRGEEHWGRCATWPNGTVHVAPFNEVTAAYVCGYVVKKMTAVDDPRLDGKHPEFGRMSRNPGVGAPAMALLARALEPHLEAGSDVPSQIRIGGKLVSMPRYLLERLRLACGFTRPEIAAIKEAKAYEGSLDLSALLDVAIQAAPLEPTNKTRVYLKEVQQKILQVETRHKIWSKKGSL